MTQGPMRIESDQWAKYFAKIAAQGFTWFDFLTVIDRDESCEVICRVVNLVSGEAELVSTNVTETVDSLSSTYVGSCWYEREAQEMFGVKFIGLADERPLLHRSDTGDSPMRKSAML